MTSETPLSTAAACRRAGVRHRADNRHYPLANSLSEERGEAREAINTERSPLRRAERVLQRPPGSVLQEQSGPVVGSNTPPKGGPRSLRQATVRIYERIVRRGGDERSTGRNHLALYDPESENHLFYAFCSPPPSPARHRRHQRVPEQPIE
ncbi:hypothetical protein EYF80_048619 [Liparis tanakae]|uniref:Uncharacterized protein n=1 Tax=Liparis tanakae TaxID=230148 RepID=A0A4Z2FK97_9TELE|nr:hypothetical protein EYF80_048619 [Liparis tanakae]